jgi:multiple sugar transport system permease protein
VLRVGTTRLAALALLLWTVGPIYWLVVTSVVDTEELLSRPAHLYPHAPHLRRYSELLQLRLFPPGGLLAPGGDNRLALEGWRNSLLIALVVVPLTLIVALPAAYALGRLRFPYRGALLAGLVLTRAYPPVTVLIPFSALFVQFGLAGTLPGLVIAHLTLTIPLVAWIMSGFFASLPRSLEQAARIDGLTRLQGLVHVLLPIARPGLVVCGVIAFLTTWNEFFFALVLTSGSRAQTAPLNMSSGGPAAAVISLCPALVLALLFQRQIRSLNIVDPL